MKHIILAITLLTIISLTACSVQVSTSTETTANNTPMVTLTQPTADNAAEESEIRDLVRNFGKRLQMVSLLAPDAAQEMQKQYSEFVSPALLEMWANNVSKAPGRIVSSPWPDQIEITTLSKGSGRYEITGFVVEVTSTEVGSGEAAAKIPVRIVVQEEQGRWLITEDAEEQ